MLEWTSSTRCETSHSIAHGISSFSSVASIDCSWPSEPRRLFASLRKTEGSILASLSSSTYSLKRSSSSKPGRMLLISGSEDTESLYEMSSSSVLIRLRRRFQGAGVGLCVFLPHVLNEVAANADAGNGRCRLPDM